MLVLKVTALFVATAIAEIVGCWLVLLWRKGESAWLLVPAALSVAAFACVLTLHPVASGRFSAAYAGISGASAIAWLVLVDGARLDSIDVLGGGLILLGALVMVGGHWRP